MPEIIPIDESSCGACANWPASYCGIPKCKADDLQVMPRRKAPLGGSFLKFGIVGVEADDVVTLPTETDSLVRVVRPVMIIQIPADEC